MTNILTFFQVMSKKHKILLSFIVLISLFISFMEIFNLYLISLYFNSLNHKSSFNPDFYFFILSVSITFIARLFYLHFFSRVNASISSTIAVKIYHNIINTNLSEVRLHGKGEMLNSLMEKCQLVMLNFLNPLMLIIISLFTSFGILIYMIVNENLIFIFGFLLLICTYIAILMRNQKQLFGLSVEQNKLLDSASESVHWLVEGIRELKIASWKGLDIGKAFQKDVTDLRVTQAKIYFLSNYPRIFIEGLIFISVGLIAVYAGSSATLSNSILATSFYGFLKLLPSLQTMYAGITAVRGTSDSARNIIGLLKMRDSIQVKGVLPEISDRDCIELVQFSLNIPGRERTSPINLKIKRNEVFGIFGPSGSGKSSMLDCVAGLSNSYTGLISYFGTDIQTIDKHELANNQAYIGQQAYLFGNTLKQILNLNSEEDYTKVEKLLLRYGLGHLALAYTTGSDFVGTNADLLSGGEKKRLAWINVLINQPKVLFLDEVTSGLDQANENLLLSDLVLLKNTTIIAVTHSEVFKAKVNGFIELK